MSNALCAGNGGGGDGWILLDEWDVVGAGPIGGDRIIAKGNMKNTDLFGYSKCKYVLSGTLVAEADSQEPSRWCGHMYLPLCNEINLPSIHYTTSPKVEPISAVLIFDVTSKNIVVGDNNKREVVLTCASGSGLVSTSNEIAEITLKNCYQNANFRIKSTNLKVRIYAK